VDAQVVRADTLEEALRLWRLTWNLADTVFSSLEAI
jgi:hypothetical protein